MVSFPEVPQSYLEGLSASINSLLVTTKLSSLFKGRLRYTSKE